MHKLSLHSFRQLTQPIIPCLFATFFGFTLLLLGLSSCDEQTADELEEGLEDAALIFDPLKFNRNINQEAHEKMEELLPEGIAVFAFHPGGGWVIVTRQGSKFARNIPEECNTKLEEFLANGHEIRSIAFPPKGGNSWVIVTDQDKFARNIPEECNTQLESFMARGEEIRHVAFPFERPNDNSWLIIGEDSFFARNIDDECYQLLRNLEQVYEEGKRISRPVYSVAFEPGGGWAILAKDYYFARNIDEDAFQKMGDFSGDKRQISVIAFDPDGSGWSVIANDQYSARPVDHEIEIFEENVAGKSIWQHMRDSSVQAVSVAVVVDNQVLWTTAYGHLRKGESHAAHPESMFQAASISKAVTAVGMHKLVDEGKIALTDDIRDDLSVTIPVRSCISSNSVSLILEDVMSHRSSVMGRGSSLPLTNCTNFNSRRGGGYDGYGQNTSIPSLNQIIAGSGPANSDPISLSQAPGSFNYSGDGYTLLQKLIEDLSGDTYSNWMTTEILQLMGMNDSYFQINPPQHYFDDNQFAYGYDTGDNAVPGGHNRYPEFAAAGLYTTAPDLARMLIMLNQQGQIGGKQVLSTNSADNIAQNGVGVFTNGFTTNNPYYTHGGTNRGFRSVIVGFPDIDAGVVVMTNRQNSTSSFRVAVAQAVIDAYGW